MVGAGLAGATAAHILGRQWRVTLVDPRSSCPPVFRAEKIEPDQVDLLRELGLGETLLPHTRRVYQIQAFYRNHHFGTRSIEQYGASYGAMVNTLLATLPAAVQFKVGRVVEVANNPDWQCVRLAGGETLTCRLIIFASGSNSDLLRALHLQRAWVQKYHSLSAGFMIARKDGQPFSFGAATCSSANAKTGIDYVTFFPIENTMRANLFAYPVGDNSWLQRLAHDPNRELRRLFPRLERAIRDYEVVGKVDAAITNLYRTEGQPQPGVVLLGDASQNTSPPTGRGLTKIFTDVLVLRECVPCWFETQGLGSEKVQQFLDHPRKKSADTKAARDAAYRRNACCGRTLQWRIHRTKLRLKMQLARA
ncbi:MAG TPA: FAD-dependent monooxygenase [Dongiaceae bacterium]|nr:FAD-dependent monooxygenase [Dongiaceae bacterium]